MKVISGFLGFIIIILVGLFGISFLLIAIANALPAAIKAIDETEAWLKERKK